jgi:hypothetical protein
MTPEVPQTKRFNLKVPEEIKIRIRQIALEINPERPRVSDVLAIAIMIHDSDPVLWRSYVTKYMYSR